jgi:hypothetical protein
MVLPLPTILRDLEEMMDERGLSIDHTTVWRWVQMYAPEINKRIRPHLAVNMIRKGQVKRLAGSDAMGQAKFVASLFQIAA